ncbi:hypothetical protein VTN77DRAFT_7443 [Rasamsonia byssochlamydoides]|uniref:uncharacterized protein n=1 Tax=Rasamsonia byssochlamydoides TaxID=89139 RepID=UPI00374425F0
MADDLTIEGEQQIFLWNQTAPESVDVCTHELIRARSLSRPHSPAVCAWDGNLTYAELEELSSRLAHHLATIGTADRASTAAERHTSRFKTAPKQRNIGPV